MNNMKRKVNEMNKIYIVKEISITDGDRDDNNCIFSTEEKAGIEFDYLVKTVKADLEVENGDSRILNDGYCHFTYEDEYRYVDIEIIESYIDQFTDPDVKLPEQPEERIITLSDCDSNTVAKTNAPSNIIDEAIAYKNSLLENDDPEFSSDFESMQDYISKAGYYLEYVGIIENNNRSEIEDYEW